MQMIKFKPSNSIFTNWNKDIYIATKDLVSYDDYNNEIVIYNTPFYFGKVNYQPLTAKQLEAYIQTYGETENNTTYNATGTNANDDAPDACALFASEIIEENSQPQIAMALPDIRQYL